MSRLRYDQIAPRLQKLDRWLDQVGLTNRDRIRLHIQNITTLADAQSKGTLSSIALDSERERELLWSFVEGLEFLDAMESLIAAGCPPQVQVLERALNGPVEPFRETEMNNLGRNTMFEIVLAGDIAGAGLKPQLGAEPDIKFGFGDRRLLIACKRLLSARGIQKQIGIASRKLGRNLQAESDPRDCGVIALSVTRVFTTGEQLLEVDSEAQVNEYLHRELIKLADQHRNTWLNIKSPKISGILFHISTPGLIVQKKLVIAAAQTLLIHIEGKSDVTLLEEFGNRLKARSV